MWYSQQSLSIVIKMDDEAVFHFGIDLGLSEAKSGLEFELGFYSVEISHNVIILGFRQKMNSTFCSWYRIYDTHCLKSKGSFVMYCNRRQVPESYLETLFTKRSLS